MLKKIIKNLPFINSIAIALLLCAFLFNHFFNSEKIVYVDNMKLFDGFNMTKEMKKVGEKEFNTRKALLDSLYSKLQTNSVSEIEKKQLMPQFIQGKEELEQFNQRFAGEESLKIWSRIHGYVDEYSKETNYKLIIGSPNKESVLFADEKVDKTNELLAYINKKYEGIK
ncbi:OmpH family outer membrane protein [Flavobacterium psychrophilum]|uniref:OmpH family outer membrane protein n=1 Tax=Flavobacterium psychrophilum TaxID=96345 RepID=UPI0015C62A6C|nr:OmpH family outer membrane protein [Flavobacterium psychrophilum]